MGRRKRRERSSLLPIVPCVLYIFSLPSLPTTQRGLGGGEACKQELRKMRRTIRQQELFQVEFAWG